MWDFHHSTIFTITFGTPTQKNLIQFMNALNAELNYYKLELDIVAKEQLDTAVALKQAHKQYMIVRHCLQEVNMRGGLTHSDEIGRASLWVS